MLLDTLFTRASLNNPNISLHDTDALLEILGGGSTSESGENVTHGRALTYSPVWQAVKMISGDVSKLPLNVYRRLDDGGRTVDHDSLLQDLIGILGRANDEISSVKLWRRAMVHALLWENAYIWIERDSQGRAISLSNLLPDRTSVTRSENRLWIVTEINRQIEVLPIDDVIHIEGLCFDGMQAPDLVQQARHDIGLALAARTFTSRFFANGANVGGILQVPPHVQKQARDKIEAAVADKFANRNKWFKTMVLRDGYRWHATTVDPEKSQLIELDEQQVRHVARWFSLSPDRLGVNESVSFNSLEQRKQDYFDTTLTYWLLSIKSELNLKLITERERRERIRFIDYNVNALLWTDAKTRNEIAVAGIQNGRFSPDETRAWENLNPRGDSEGSQFLRPLNMTVAGEDTSSAARELLGETATRIAKRIGVHARRASKDGKRYLAWLDRFDEDHVSVCADMLRRPLELYCEHCGRSITSVDNVAAARDMMMTMKGQLNTLADVKTARELPAAVESLMEQWETERAVEHIMQFVETSYGT